MVRRRTSETPPDWDSLRAIGREMTLLRKAGKWTPAEYARLLSMARIAVNGHTEFLEFILIKNPAGCRLYRDG